MGISFERRSLAKFAAAALIILLIPVLLPNPFLVHVLQTIGIYFIAALGLNVLVGYTGQVSLGHAGFYAVGAYTSGLLTLKAHLPFWLGLVTAPFLAAAVGAILALLSLRTKGPYLAMITIAFGLVTFFVANQWISLTGGPMGLYGVPKASFFGQTLGLKGYFYLIAFTGLVLQVMTNNLLGRKWGRAFRALSLSEVAAETVGVNAYLWKTLAFSVSAFFAGLAGAFFAHQSGYLNSDTFTFNTSVVFLVAVILGGSGTSYGPLLGTVVLTLIPQFFQKLANYHLFIYGGLLLFALIAMPEGIVGSLGRFFSPKGTGFAGHKRTWRPEVGAARENAQGKKLLVIEQISKVFGLSGGGRRRRQNTASREAGTGLRAVDQVDLTVDPGTIHGLIGPNGSGKSTLVNLITGVYLSSDGSVHWLGEEISDCSPHEVAGKGITRTFQNLQLFNELTALENVLVGFHIHLKAGLVDHVLNTKRAVLEEAEFKEKALDLLAFMGLEEFAGEKAQNLSYGNQRRLEIARALAVGPRLLILDEPAAGLNTAETEELSQLIKRIRDAGITVLVIEHHMELIMGISDRVSVLDYGRKIAEGSPDEIQANPKVVEAYLGSGRKVAANASS